MIYLNYNFIFLNNYIIYKMGNINCCKKPDEIKKDDEIMNDEEVNQLDNDGFPHDSVQANKEANNQNEEAIKPLPNNEEIEEGDNENQNENQGEEEEQEQEQEQNNEEQKIEDAANKAYEQEENAAVKKKTLL